MESENRHCEFTGHWQLYAYVAGGAAVLATLASLCGYQLCAVIAGGVSAVFAVILTAVITANQDKGSSELNRLTRKVDDTVTRIKEATDDIKRAVHDIKELQEQSSQLLLEMKEARADKAYASSEVSGTAKVAEGVDSGFDVVAGEPGYKAEAIDALKSAGADLDFEELQWDQKIPESAKPGNYGWFVSSKTGASGTRWFVRKANGISVRKAMPQDFLDALCERERISPRSIRHDFQMKNHGLASWYARTYSGKLYRVSRSNRSGGKEIQVELVESE